MQNLEKASNLYVKSFFAMSIPAAMEQAQRELGPDALLLNAREAPAEARHLGDFEVVFGANQDTLAAAAATPKPADRVMAASIVAAPKLAPGAWMARPVDVPQPAAGTIAASTVAADGDSATAAEKDTAEAMPSATAKSRIDPRRSAHRRTVARTSAHAGRDMRRTLLAERARKKASKGTLLNFAKPEDTASPEPPAPTADELANRFEVRPEIGRITVLVGPPGAGKTTTLVKLAVNECLKQGRPVKFLSADTVRIGGAYQLRTYATILGVPFQAVEGIAALAQAIEATPPNTFLLIDTPGFSAALQQELGAELATFLRHRQDIDTQLVLTASMGPAELQATVDRFAPFNPAKLIFTRMDETTSTASIISEAERTRRPISFLCNGQSVPEDILPASKDLIISSLVRQLPDSLQAVA